MGQTNVYGIMSVGHTKSDSEEEKKRNIEVLMNAFVPPAVILMVRHHALKVTKASLLLVRRPARESDLRGKDPGGIGSAWKASKGVR